MGNKGPESGGRPPPGGREGRDQQEQGQTHRKRGRKTMEPYEAWVPLIEERVKVGAPSSIFSETEGSAEDCGVRRALTASVLMTAVCQMPEEPGCRMDPRQSSVSFPTRSLHPGSRSVESRRCEYGWRPFRHSIQEGRNPELCQMWVLRHR